MKKSTLKSAFMLVCKRYSLHTIDLNINVNEKRYSRLYEVEENVLIIWNTA